MIKKHLSIVLIVAMLLNSFSTNFATNLNINMIKESLSQILESNNTSDETILESENVESLDFSNKDEVIFDIEDNTSNNSENILVDDSSLLSNLAMDENGDYYDVPEEILENYDYENNSEIIEDNSLDNFDVDYNVLETNKELLETETSLEDEIESTIDSTNETIADNNSETTSLTEYVNNEINNEDLVEDINIVKEEIVSTYSEIIDSENLNDFDGKIIDDELFLATNSVIDTKNDSIILGEDENWMYWYLEDNGKTIRFTNTKPEDSDNGISATGLESEISYGNLVKSNITKAVFDNQIKAQSCHALFKDFTNLVSIENMYNLDTTNVKSMRWMFHGLENIASLDVSSLNTSKVTDIRGMFQYCNKLTKLDLTDFFDSAKLDCMGYMFANCQELQSITFGNNIDTSNVYDMQSMFVSCRKLTELDLSGFDTSSLLYADQMFNSCNSLKTIKVSEKFVTDKVTNSNDMFKGCNELTGGNGTKYNSSIIDKSYAKIDKEGEPGYFTNAVQDENWMYWYLTDNGKTICFTNTKPEDSDNGISATGLESEISYGNLVKSNITKAVFDNQIEAQSCHALFKDFTNLVTIENMNNLDTSNVKSMRWMFCHLDNITSLDVSSLNTSNVTDIRAMFQYCYKLTNLDLTDFFDSAKLDCMGYMFANCQELQSITFGNNIDTSNVYDMQSMFVSCRKLTELDLSGFDTSSLLYADQMFNSCNSLKTIKVSDNFVTDKVTQSNDMFLNCTELIGGNGTKYVDTLKYNKEYARKDKEGQPGYFTDSEQEEDENWMYWYLEDNGNTIHFTNKKPAEGGNGIKSTGDEAIDYGNLEKGNITKAIFDNKIEALTCMSLFDSFKNLTSIENLNNLDTTNVTNMNKMFKNCLNISTIDLSSFNTSKVTTMAQLFYCCQKLTSINLSNIDVSKVTNMEQMFYSCRELPEIDISDFNTSNLDNMYCMFAFCSKLKFIDLSNFDTSKVQDISFLFGNSNNITKIIVSEKFVTSNVSVENSKDMFNFCNSLVGGNGTIFSKEHIGKEYARIDKDGEPGYFTGVDQDENWMYWYLEDNGKTIHFTNTKPEVGGNGIKAVGKEEINYGNLTKTNITKAVIDNKIIARTCNKLFDGFTELLDIENFTYFDTSKVTNMTEMFKDCSLLNNIDLGNNFDTSNVTTMTNMFSGVGFSDLELPMFNVSNVESMQSMFRNCKNLKYLNISSFDTKNIFNTRYMFQDCDKLQTIIVSENFVVDNIESGFHNDMFKNCNSLVGGNGTKYDSSKIDKTYAKIDIDGQPGYFTNENWMYWYLEDNGNTIRFTNTKPSEGGNGIKATGDEAIDYGNLEKGNITKAIFDNKINSLTCMSLFDSFTNLITIENLNYLDTTNVTNMSKMFKDCQKISTIDLSSLNTSKVTTMEQLFSWCNKLTSINLSNIDVTKVTNMEYMFFDCRELPEIDVSDFNTSNLVNMDSMFAYCNELKFIDLSSFDTSKVQYMSFLFGHSYNITKIIVSEKFVTSNVSDEESSDMFKNCDSLVGGNGTIFSEEHIGKEYARIDKDGEPGYFTGVDQDENWMYWYLEDNGTTIHFTNTKPEDSDNGISATGLDSEISYGNLVKSNITKAVFDNQIEAQSCHALFKDFTNLVTIENMNNLDTSNVKSMRWMFCHLDNITSLDVSSLNTSNVTDIRAMFQYCYKLTKLDLTDFFDSAKVDCMGYMFADCQELLSITFGNNIDTSNVYDMQSMFVSCRKLTELDLSGFDTSSLLYADQMFNSCNSLKTIKVSDNFVTDKVTQSNDMFLNCTELIGGNGTKYDASKIDKTYAKIDKEGQSGYFTSKDEDIVSISIATQPTNTKYKIGEKFDPTGLSLTAELLNGETKTINYSNIDKKWSFEPDITKELTVDDKQITIKYKNVECDEKINLNIIEPESIKISTPQTKETYNLGESFDPTGLEVSVLFSDDETKDNIKYEGNEDKFEFVPTTAFDTIGDSIEVTIKLNYYDKNFECKTNVKVIGLDSISIKNNPNKMTYKIGDNFEPTGLILELKYSDSSSKDLEYNNDTKSLIAFSQTTPFDSAGNKNVIIYYENKNCELVVNVIDIVSIDINTNPTRLKYTIGEYFDPNGLVITAKYDNDDEEKIEYNDNTKSDFSFEPNNAFETLGENNITVKYKNKNCDLIVNIVEVDSIEIKSVPKKTQYTEGEKFNPNGLSLLLNFSDDTKSEVTYNNNNKNNFIFEPSLNTVLTSSIKQISVKYANKNTTIDINVNKKTRPSGGGSGSIGGNYISSLETQDYYTMTNLTINNTPEIKFNINANLIDKWDKDIRNNKWRLSIKNEYGNPVFLSNGLYHIVGDVYNNVNNALTKTTTDDLYYFDKDGYMVTGFITTPDNKQYLFEPENNQNLGKLVKGWKVVDGSWYFFDLIDGMLCKNITTPDGYKIGPDGKWSR